MSIKGGSPPLFPIITHLHCLAQTLSTRLRLMEGLTRISMFSLSFTFLATNLESGLAARTNPSGGTEFIRTSCQTTSYPALCFSSLSGQASAIQTSPSLLAQAALSVSLNGARTTSSMMTSLSTGSGLKPKEVATMKDCIENIRNSVDEIRQSMGEMAMLRGKDFGLHMNNMQTWLSAALTDENTCMDSFAGKAMNGDLKNAVRAKIVSVAHMTSNALALVNALASTQGSLN